MHNKDYIQLKQSHQYIPRHAIFISGAYHYFILDEIMRHDHIEY